jgi:hypothetical protein
MSLMSRLMGWMARLPPAATHDVVVEKNLEVPMSARDLGSREPLVTATTLREASQQVYHDPDHPFAVIRPIVNKHQADQ